MLGRLRRLDLLVLQLLRVGVFFWGGGDVVVAWEGGEGNLFVGFTCTLA